MSGGSICGGVISESQHRKNVAKYGVWADTMSFVMPDEAYTRYVHAIEAGDKKLADKLFAKHAVSQI